MDHERLQQIVTEFEAPETEASQKSILMDELSQGVGSLISAKEKITGQLSALEKQNLELQKTNSHYANRLASQYVGQEEKKQEIKKQEQKNRTLSDALNGR